MQTACVPHLLHRCLFGILGFLHGCDIGEGGLVRRARELTEEVLEVVRTRRAPHQEYGSYLNLQSATQAGLPFLSKMQNR